MLEFLAALGSVFSFGSSGVMAKQAIQTVGRFKAISYFYITEVALLLIVALLLGITIQLPQDLIIPYIAQAAIGAFGVIAYFKALEQGKASILAPIGRVHVLLVVIAGVFLFGEALSALQMGGSLLIIASALVIALFGKDGMKSEKGVGYMVFAILGWGYYFTFLKIFVDALGPFLATLVTESGVAFIVIGYYLIRRRDLSPPSLKEGKFAIGNGVLVFFGALLYNFSIEKIGIALTASVVAGAPIVTAIFSYVFLREKLDPHKYAAIALLVIGLIMIFLLG